MTRMSPDPVQNFRKCRFHVSTLLRPLLSALLGLALVACQSTDLAGLAPGFSRPASSSAGPILGEAEIRAPATFVVDYATGRTLYQENPDALRFPASLTKMMTLYLLFEAIEAGRLSLDDELLVSENAASKPPAKLGIEPGSTIRVRDAIQVIAVKSANDLATVIAESLAGSEEAFAAAMTAKARALGMMRTRFVNASGLPDERQVTTARDMATLARALRSRFPRYAPYFAAREFTYGGRTFKATNKLLGKVPGVDGIKTGYIRDAGFHLAATAERGGRRIIVVVMGGETGKARDAKVTELIERYL